MVAVTGTSEVSTLPAETMPDKTWPPASSAIIAAAVSIASVKVATLMPFSKREEDSERRLRRPEVLRIDLPSKRAASSTTVLELLSISVLAPPMTPPRATALSPTEMTMSSAIKSRSSPSRVTKFSPSFAWRATIFLPSNLSKSKACIGWPK